MSARTLRIGTRASALALWQANRVADLIRAQPGAPAVELVHIRTEGDVRTDIPLWAAGGRAFFTHEIDRAQLAGEVDIAVHSLKDLSTLIAAGLELAAVLEREDPRDALLTRQGAALSDLPQGARVGTSSLRRRAFLLRARPDLTLLELRGNVPTRIERLEQGRYDAIVLATAGLKRLDLAAHIAAHIEPAVMPPAVVAGRHWRLRAHRRCSGPAMAAPAGSWRHARGGDRRARAVAANRGRLPGAAGGAGDAERATPAAAGQRLRAGWIDFHGMPGPGAKRVTPWPWAYGLPSNCWHAAPAPSLPAARTAERGTAVNARPRDYSRWPVIVTRDEPVDGPLSRELRALGLEVLGWPVLSIAPASDATALEQALRRLNQFEWLVFASQHAVAEVVRRGTGPTGLSEYRSRRARTAQALTAAGWQVAAVPDAQTADGLVALLRPQLAPGASILFAAGVPFVAHTARRAHRRRCRSHAS
ncbi:MAG: hydroxymethylbilane synthase [Steroidobacteraceae bacterium]